MSNPLRQSLYTLNDCLNGGEFKAISAVKNLKLIFPAVVCNIYVHSHEYPLWRYLDGCFFINRLFLEVNLIRSESSQEAEGVVMAIPMPGHPVPSEQEESVLNDCQRLHDLINSHDVVFLLTDTRESRWLPTLFSAASSKVLSPFSLFFIFLVPVLCRLDFCLWYCDHIILTHGGGHNPVSSDWMSYSSVSVKCFSTCQCPWFICFWFLQITITAALGFDSFLVMRHGAGPFSTSNNLKIQTLSGPPDSMDTASLSDNNCLQRLGCYFCNDVVAPIDVIF